MPTLIMASVPITETASANGLNALLRALGTSSSSAAVAAVLGSVTIQLGPAKLPSLTAFQDVFWMAGLGALAGCAVAWYIPAARRVTVGDPEILETDTLGVTAAGENKEIVVHGRVLQLDQKPAHPAVVTVLTTDGCSVDWTRGDTDGKYSVVLPGPGKYLVLANALGWAPRAEVFEFRDETSSRHITLTDRLTISGKVTRGGRPVGRALVTLTEATGEVVGSVRADGTGSYCIPLPQAGRYIVTMLEPDTLQATARKLVLDVRSAVIDIDVPTPVPATATATPTQPTPTKAAAPAPAPVEGELGRDPFAAGR